MPSPEPPRSSAQSHLYDAARRVIPTGARGWVRRVGGRPYVRAARTGARPDLSVIVPVYNVAAYLRECLDSALGQTLWNLEVICVDDGSTDGCLDILREYERTEPRIRVLTQANSGQGVARNLGVEHARGEFLTFLDSDDVIPPEAYEHMVTGLRATGSDFSVGAAQRFAAMKTMPVSWNRVVHRSDRLSTTIDDFPEAMQDIICANRMFRTDFWRKQIGGFRGHIAYEDHVPMLAAYVRAERFDILSEVTYRWRVREDNTSTGQQKASLENLLDRIAVKEEAHQLLVGEASTKVYDAWVARTLDVDFPAFLTPALTATDLYRSILAATYRTFIERCSPEALRQVRHYQKLRAWLAAEERWGALGSEIDTHRLLHGMLPRTQVADGQVLAEASDDSLLAGAPDWVLTLADYETNLEAAVEKVRWLDDTHIELQGFAFVRGVDCAQEPPTTTASLVEAATGTEVPLGIEQYATTAATRYGNNPSTQYDQAGFRTVVDVAALVEQSAEAGADWGLRFDVESQGIRRSGPAPSLVRFSSAAVPEHRAVEAGNRVVHVVPGLDRSIGYALKIRPGPLPERIPILPRIEVRQVSLDGTVLVVRAASTGLPATALQDLEVRNDRVSLPRLAAPGEDVGDADNTDDTGVTARFDTRVSVLGGPTAPAPSGRYLVGLQLLAADFLPAQAARSLADVYPVELVNDQHHITVANTPPDSHVSVTLAAPLTESEQSLYGQRTLQRAYRTRTTSPREAVFFQCYRGEFATDSQRALDERLRVTRPELIRYWGVADRSTQVPEGSVPLLIGSAQWYDALVESRYLCNNIDFDGWFLKRPHQRYLQTFHGYPFKSMGRTFWSGKGFDPARISRENTRRNLEWDTILVPSRFCVDFYREEYDFTGEILAVGYPRSDFMVTANRAETRAQVLGRLGIPEHKQVVLYAPTYRDNLTTRTYAAARFDELDLVKLSDALGPDTVILLRGHNNNQRELDRVLSIGGVVDVTDYPEINELTVAADTAILDYSSLRFDWALTGKPMLFFVPDLDTYFAQRPPLFDFEESAPGPLLRSTDEVIAALRNTSALTSEYSGAIQEFNRRFNDQHDGGATDRVIQAFFA